MTKWNQLALAPALLLLVGCTVDLEDDEAVVAELSQEITSGSRLDLFQMDGKYQAIVQIPGCSATLIDDEVVLTAAHCVCPSDNSPVGCQTRTTVTFRNVAPASTPNGALQNLTIDGDVVVYPDYGNLGWLREDYAVIELDQPAYDVAHGVVPHILADASRTPSPGDTVYLAGYGPTGSDCSVGTSVGRIGTTTPSEVVFDGIRFNGSVLGCPGDSGGPTLDEDLFLLGVASWSSSNSNGPTESTYRPAYEKHAWIQGRINGQISGADYNRFDVSRGGSWDLGAYNDLYVNYRPTVGIVGQAISPHDGYVYTWYRNGTYSRGRTWDPRSSVKQATFTTHGAYDPDDIVGIAFSTSNIVYTFYRWGKVTVGTPTDLDAYAGPYSFSASPGHGPDDIVGVDISSSDVVYTWYDDGTRSTGRTWDLDAYGTGTYGVANGKTYADVVGIAIAQSNNHIYTWYRAD